MLFSSQSILSEPRVKMEIIGETRLNMEILRETRLLREPRLYMEILSD